MLRAPPLDLRHTRSIGAVAAIAWSPRHWTTFSGHAAAGYASLRLAASISEGKTPVQVIWERQYGRKRMATRTSTNAGVAGRPFPRPRCDVEGGGLASLLHYD